MFDTGAQLRKVRKKASLTLDQLAGLSGIDRGTISRIELGHVSPRIDTIDCLCQAMNTNLPFFFGNGFQHLAAGNDLAVAEPGAQAGPYPGSPQEAANAKVEDTYWPVPASVWQSLVDVVERFEALLANSGELVLVMNGVGRIIYLSPGGESMLGFKRSELLGKAMVEVVHPDDRGRFQVALQGGPPGAAASREYRLMHKKGHWHRFECSISDHLQSPSVRALILNAAPIQAR